MVQNPPCAKDRGSERWRERSTVWPWAASPTRNLFSSSFSCYFSHPGTEHEDLNYQCERVQPTHFSSSVLKTLCFLVRRSWRGSCERGHEAEGRPAWGERSADQSILWVAGRRGQGPRSVQSRPPRKRPTGKERGMVIKEDWNSKYPHRNSPHVSILFDPPQNSFTLFYFTLASSRQDCH